MNNVSKNGIDLIKTASKKANSKFMKAFVGTLVMFAPLIALCFIPYAGWALSVLLFGVFETGYIRYFRRLINDENASLKVLFSEFKTGWLETFLGAVLVIMFILGGVLLIVPGIILIGLYSMGLFVADQYKTEGIVETLKLTRNKTKGHTTSMLAYKSIFAFIYLILLVVGFFGFWGIYILYATSPALAVVVGVVAALIILILFCVITTYYHACNEVLFQEMIAEDVKPVVEEKVETKERKPRTKKETK